MEVSNNKTMQTQKQLQFTDSAAAVMEVIEEELRNMKDASASMNDGHSNYQISMQYKFVGVVGEKLQGHEYAYAAGASNGGFTHSGQNLGPGVEYEIKISGSMKRIGSTANLNALQQKQGNSVQPKTFIFYMYAPIGYPAKKLEFSIKQVLNITEYLSNDVLRRINELAAFRTHKRQRSLEWCYYIICKNIFDQFVHKNDDMEDRNLEQKHLNKQMDAHDQGLFINAKQRSGFEDEEDFRYLRNPKVDEDGSKTLGSEDGTQANAAPFFHSDKAQRAGKGSKDAFDGEKIPKSLSAIALSYFEEEGLLAYIHHQDLLGQSIADEYQEFVKQQLHNRSQPISRKQPEESKKNNQSSSKQRIIPYPRSSSFAWSNRGQLVTFAYHKYDFNKMEKLQEAKSGTKSKEKNQRNLNPRGIPETGFDFKQFFQQLHYFKRNQQGLGGQGYGINGSVMDGARTVFGHENGTVIDGFDQTIQSQSLFFRDDALAMKNDNATIRTIGEETSNQMTNQLTGNQSGYGLMADNRMKDQQPNEQSQYINQRLRNAGKKFGSGLIPSDIEENPMPTSYNNTSTPGFTLQVLAGEPNLKDKRETQQPGRMSRKVSYAEDVYHEMIPEETDSREFALNMIKIGSSSSQRRKEKAREKEYQRKREQEAANVENWKLEADWKLKNPAQMARKVSGMTIQQSKAFKQPFSLQSQNKKSNVYLLDFSKAQKLNFEMTQKLDLLNKADLKQQIQKLLCDGVTNNEDIWKLINTTFGNLSKNTLFSDTNRSSQTNLIFWRQKIQVWKNHPLGLGMIYKLLLDFQSNQDFVQFCILTATLFEYELRIYKYISQYSRQQAPNQLEHQVSQVPQIVLKNKLKKQMLKNQLPYNIGALPSRCTALKLNETSMVQNGMELVKREQFLKCISRNSSRSKSRKSQCSQNSIAFKGGQMRQPTFKSFGNLNDHLDENKTNLSLTYEHDEDKKSHKSNTSHKSPQSHQSPNEHLASYPLSHFDDSNEHDDAGQAKSSNVDRQSERYREEQRSNGGQSHEAAYRARDILRKNAGKIGLSSPDFKNVMVHSHSALPLPGSGGSDLSNQSLPKVERMAAKEQERRGDLSNLSRTNQAGTRGGRMDAGLDVGEVDQEANISKKFLGQRDNTPGAADRRYPHTLQQTMMLQRAKNNNMMYPSKPQEPAPAATSTQRSQDQNMISHRLTDQSAFLTADLVLIKTDVSNSEMVPSLIINEKPHQSLALLMYLKKFSELLVAWGQSSKAIQVSKIISRSYALYESMNGAEHPHSSGLAYFQNQNQIQSASARSTQQNLQAPYQSSSASAYPQSSITISAAQTPFNLSLEEPNATAPVELGNELNILKTYLLFSEQSLQQGWHQNAFVDNMVPCPDCTDEANSSGRPGGLPLECQICNLTVRGLAFQCIECGHGGHRAHIQKWIQQQIARPTAHRGLRGTKAESLEAAEWNDQREPQTVKCPCGWCECTMCFLNFKIG